MYQLLLVAAMVVLIAIDQLTKWLAVQGLQAAPVSLWDGVLELCYHENRGIAWGMFQNSRWVVIIVTGVVLAGLLVLLLSGRFRTGRLVTVGGTLVLAGGIGNLIDRVGKGYVVDFIHYYKWFDFPVFNFADCCVTIGALLILLYVFFSTSHETEKEKQGTDGKQAADSDQSTNG